jgi:hypothetical protein
MAVTHLEVGETYFIRFGYVDVAFPAVFRGTAGSDRGISLGVLEVLEGPGAIPAGLGPSLSSRWVCVADRDSAAAYRMPPFPSVVTLFSLETVEVPPTLLQWQDLRPLGPASVARIP